MIDKLKRLLISIDISLEGDFKSSIDACLIESCISFRTFQGIMTDALFATKIFSQRKHLYILKPKTRETTDCDLRAIQTVMDRFASKNSSLLFIGFQV